MTEGLYRIAIVGASTLLGKELSEELQNSLLAASDLVLLDEEETSGQVTAAGEEAAIIQRIEPSSFNRMDFVFFAGTRESTRKHWMEARRAGASIVDVTGELEGEKGVPVRAPFVTDALRRKAADRLNLETPAVVAAHPAAVILALIAARLQAAIEVSHLAAVLLEPASQYGKDAMDELHQQTVSLLSFKDLPRTEYDAQVAFNVLPELGEDAKVRFADSRRRVQVDYAGLSAGLGAPLPPLALDLVHAPVFHAYTGSVLVETSAPTTPEALVKALEGESIDILRDSSDVPSNLSAAGQEAIMIRVRNAGQGDALGTRFWLWLAADNLKLSALIAISCAQELRRLRPQGKIQ